MLQSDKLADFIVSKPFRENQQKALVHTHPLKLKQSKYLSIELKYWTVFRSVYISFLLCCKSKLCCQNVEQVQTQFRKKSTFLSSRRILFLIFVIGFASCKKLTFVIPVQISDQIRTFSNGSYFKFLTL